MVKNKILKILPYYLSVIFLLIAAVLAAPLLTSKTPTVTQGQITKPQPQILGAETDLRGKPDTTVKQLKPITQPNISAISSGSFLVFDLNSGQDLLAKNPSQKLAIASLTKLMTGLVAYQNISLDQDYPVTAKDKLNVSPALNLKAGDAVKALDVFNAMIIGSNNDAAKALADFTQTATGQNFVQLMNRQAQSLGMLNSNFSNPMGFDSLNNYSTAEDLKLLITTTQKLSAFTDLARRTSYSFTGSLGQTYQTSATNQLLKNHDDILAIKTGYTGEAHGAMATKISLSGHEVVILVLDSQNREADTLKLKNLLETDFVEE